MKKNFTYAACIAASLALFTACSDDVTEVTNVTENAGFDQVDKYKKLPKCDDEAEGTFVYVKDSAKVFGCTGDGWVAMNGGSAEKGVDGESGEDGKDGKDGKAGEDGKAGKDGENGKDGKDGKNGEDGTSCTAKQNKDKDGYDIICNGETIGTIKNGEDGENGESGDDCTLTEGENGEVTVKCGEKSTMLFKAACGKVSYDPVTQLCGSYYDTKTQKYVDAPIKRCKNWSEVYSWVDAGEDHSDWTYDPTQYFCDDNSVIHAMCQWEDEDGNLVTKKYDGVNEYCDAENKKIAKKVPCAEGSKEMRKPTEYCYTTNDNSRMRTAEMLVCGSGNNETRYSPVTHFCKKNAGGVLAEKKVCAKNPDKADPFNIDIRYMSEMNLDDNTSELCDARDYQIYTTKTLESGHTWMLDNLRYAYKGKTASLDSSSFCYGDRHDGNGGLCTKKGRFYLWSAAIDSASYVKDDVFCGNGEFSNCKLPETVRGVCPEGWHLPSAEEADAEMGELGWPELYYPLGMFQNDEGFMQTTDQWSGYWTSTDVSAANAKKKTPVAGGVAKSSEKRDAFFVRCVLDYEKEEPAEEE